MDTEGGLVVVRGHRIMRPSGGDLAEARFTSCPLAETNRPGSWPVEVMRTLKRMEMGVPLEMMHPRPTAALLDGLQVVEFARAKRAEHIQEWERRSKGGN